MLFGVFILAANLYFITSRGNPADMDESLEEVHKEAPLSSEEALGEGSTELRLSLSKDESKHSALHNESLRSAVLLEDDDKAASPCWRSLILKPGEMTTFGLLNKCPTNVAKIQASGEASLLMVCPILSLGVCQEEKLTIVMESEERKSRILCNSRKFQRAKAQEFFLFYFRKTQDVLAESKLLCKITAVYNRQEIAVQLCPDRCGKASFGSGVTRIVGGENATEGEFPWMVFLSLQITGNSQRCGGSIITRRHVLSAAHCFLQSRKVTARIGEHDLETTSVEWSFQEIEVERWAIHPKYDIFTQQHDIAVLTLVEDIVFSDAVGPICLPLGDLHPEGRALVAGWGSPSGLSSNGSSILMKVQVDIVDYDNCSKMYEDFGPLEKDVLCALSPGKDSCYGDSGGPLFQQHSGRWYQIGVVSRGNGCASGFPGIYTTPHAYSSWILHVVSSAGR